MATTTGKSEQLIKTDTTPAIAIETTDRHGRVRQLAFDYTQSGAGDAGSTVELGRLPPTRTRVLLAGSVITCSAFGASRTLDIGHGGYTEPNGQAVPACADCLADGLDVSAAADLALGDSTTAGVAGPSLLVTPNAPLSVIATVAGGTIPDGATLTGYLLYVTD